MASQEAIKILGTNGGGFFNVNSAHPFENPTAWTNLFEIILMLVIPFSLPRTFGRMVGDNRQGYAIVGVMATLYVASAALMTWAELSAGGAATKLAGAALEGKELRFGIAGSTLFGTSSTLTSTGAVNSMHDSFTPLAGGMAMLNMMLGEVAPGGVGAGLYGILMIAVIAVFIAGLMVGRTPEYLGKKIGGREMKLASLYTLATPTLVLVGTAISFAIPAVRAGPREDVDLESRSARLQRGALRVHLGRQQQRLGLRRPHREHALARTPLSASSCCSAGSCRSCSCSRSPARSPRRTGSRSPSEPCRPTACSSPACSSAPSCWSPLSPISPFSR